MRKITRRRLFRDASLAAAAARLTPEAMAQGGTPVDFRYSPLTWQTAYCFPDDHHKSLIGGLGELRYGHPGRGKGGNDYFPEVVGFSAWGMEADRVAWQHLEGPAVPIIHTRIDRPEAYLELTTFATDDPNEGRVDNVILDLRPRTKKSLHAIPLVKFDSRREIALRNDGGMSVIHLGGESAPPFMVSNRKLQVSDDGHAYTFSLNEGVASDDRPLRCFFRFPQQGQDFSRIQAGMNDPDRLLAQARSFWNTWRPFEGAVSWRLAGQHDAFLQACARNILQAREVRDGKLTFQVGPTVYRGLWVVDGNFILESARYLGYDAEAQQGLEATWAHQAPNGGVFASAGMEHWKDTGIAMFTLVRQCELGQSWSYFRKMQPEILRAVQFLIRLRDRARNDGSPNGRYGLLAPGFGDGGLRGIRPEFTNTVWVLAGLKAVVSAADRRGFAGFEPVKQFYRELRSSFFAAARQEMRRHSGGFEYLPMLMKEDKAWSAPDIWDRPQPQTAQWALSHAIYPGLVFDRNDSVVRGHIALMQACTQEDIPAETGWLHHEGVWTYNAPFVSHVYLWAGLPDWARMTFTGFLNHASPLYCWREEQPLRGSLVSHYIGDMPHNWASAECVLYLRHMLALEDGDTLRLAPGIGTPELAAGEPYTISSSPTRFGRIHLGIEPLGRNQGWRMRFRREDGPNPARVHLPENLGVRLPFSTISGASVRREGGAVLVDPESKSWEAVWKI